MCQGIAWVQPVTGESSAVLGRVVPGVTTKDSERDKTSCRLKTDAPVIAVGAAGAITLLPQNPRAEVKPAETSFVYLLDKDT